MNSSHLDLPTRPKFAFSLVEVVIAIGVFAVAIIFIIGLLTPSLHSTREVLDSTVAARLANGVEQALGDFVRLYGTGQTAGFAKLASTSDFDPDDPTDNPIVVYASADGSHLALRDPDTGATDWDDQDPYFVVFIAQLETPASISDSFLALNVTVEWPYLRPVSEAPKSSPKRSVFLFNTALTR